MRVFISVNVLLISICVCAQINEDFEDGDFSDGSPLIWTPSQLSGGDDFAIISGELNTNGPSATGTIFISSSQSIDFVNNDVVWTFHRESNTSGCNLNRVITKNFPGLIYELHLLFGVIIL